MDRSCGEDPKRPKDSSRSIQCHVEDPQYTQSRVNARVDTGLKDSYRGRLEAWHLEDERQLLLEAVLFKLRFG